MHGGMGVLVMRTRAHLPLPLLLLRGNRWQDLPCAGCVGWAMEEGCGSELIGLASQKEMCRPLPVLQYMTVTQVAWLYFASQAVDFPSPPHDHA